MVWPAISTTNMIRTRRSGINERQKMATEMKLIKIVEQKKKWEAARIQTVAKAQEAK